MKSFYTSGLNVNPYIIQIFIIAATKKLIYQRLKLNVFRKLSSQAGVNLINKLPEFIKREGKIYKF